MRFLARPDGACLTHCLAVHAYEDPNEGERVKKCVNNHMADNMDYYQNKIELPYIETIGVGENATVIKKETYEEIKAFLKSEEAMKVYSNTHELVAIANMFNIKINICIYGDGKER